MHVHGIPLEGIPERQSCNWVWDSVMRVSSIFLRDGESRLLGFVLDFPFCSIMYFAQIIVLKEHVSDEKDAESVLPTQYPSFPFRSIVGSFY